MVATRVPFFFFFFSALQTQLHRNPAPPPPTANPKIHNHNHHHHQASTQPQPPSKNPNESKIQTHQQPSTKCVWKKKSIRSHRIIAITVWRKKKREKESSRSDSPRSLISGLGSVQFAGKAWTLGWRETLLDGTKSKPSTSDHGLGVSRISLWWWRRNWAELEKGRKKELEKGRKKEKTHRERERERERKSWRRKREDKVREITPSNMYGPHRGLNFTILPLCYVSQKLKTPIWFFRFSSLSLKNFEFWVMKTRLGNQSKQKKLCGSHVFSSLSYEFSVISLKTGLNQIGP